MHVCWCITTECALKQKLRGGVDCRGRRATYHLDWMYSPTAPQTPYLLHLTPHLRETWTETVSLGARGDQDLYWCTLLCKGDSASCWVLGVSALMDCVLGAISCLCLGINEVLVKSCCTFIFCVPMLTWHWLAVSLSDLILNHLMNPCS